MNLRRRIRNELIAYIGAGLMAVSVNCVFEPMELVTGGVTGIGIIIKELTGNIAGGEGIPLWITNLVCNIPLFILAYYLHGKRFVRRGLITAIIFTVFLAVIPVTAPPTQNILLNAILGGCIMGTGVGMIFATGSTTGGMDLLAVLLHKKIKYWSEAQILAAADGVIVAAGALLFGLEHALYALIAIFIVMRISDSILNGLKYSKMAFIISNQAEAITEYLMNEMNRGVTGIETVGMHSGTHRNMLLCVVSKKQISELKEMALTIDPNAFIIVADASEILGEGFTSA
jgi:uncharacterized membrane-anchored protein YitT (DUF2179 family)